MVLVMSAARTQAEAKDALASAIYLTAVHWPNSPLHERIAEARVLGHGEGQEHALADVVEALKALEDRMREGATCGNNDAWWADALAALRARLTGAPEPPQEEP